MRKLNKKGGIEDLVLVLGVVFTISLVLMFSFLVMDKFKEKFNEEPETQKDTHVNQSLEQIRGMFPGVLDTTLLLIMIGLFVGAMAMALMVRFHPIFFVFLIVIIGFMIVVSGAFSNAFQQIAENPEFASLASEMTLTVFVMKRLPWIIGSMACLLSLIMYKLWSAGDVM